MFCVDMLKGKVMLEVFFDSRSTVHQYFIPKRFTMSKSMCRNILYLLWEGVQCKGPQIWLSSCSLLHQVNILAHWSTLVTECLTKNGIPVLSQPPYLLDLTPADFCPFPWMEGVLKGHSSFLGGGSNSCGRSSVKYCRKRPAWMLPTMVPLLAEVYDNGTGLLWRWSMVEVATIQGKKLHHFIGSILTLSHIQAT